MNEGTRGDLQFGTIPKLAEITANQYPDALAIEDTQRQLTFSDLVHAAKDVTRALISMGVKPGDCVAIWAPNIWEWIPIAIGLQGAGAVLVPINTRYKGPEAAWILQKSEAVALFTVNGFLGNDYVDMLRQTRLNCPQLRHTVIIRGTSDKQTLSWKSFCQLSKEIDLVEAQQRWNAVQPTDLADILFTSGTTGQPKGAMTTHGQTLRAFTDWSDVVGLQHGDRYLVVAPFFHGFGYKAGWLAGLITGATILPHAVFDAGAVLARIGPDQVTMLPGPPALYQAMLNHPDLSKHDISSLRLAVTGAASIPVSLIYQMRNELGFETVITGYGLTEATAIATMCRYDDPPETIARTSGRAIPGVVVRVVDDTGATVASGTPGEVVIQGYNIMRGYLNEPEETATAIDEDGWLRTGDIGVMDSAGYLAITDRKKDMFIVGGFNAYPAEIDNTIRQHSDIADVAVIGVPDQRMGEVGMAFVVLCADAELDEASLITWCRDRMANFKVPRRISFLDALPRNAVGKVQKFKLREMMES